MFIEKVMFRRISLVVEFFDNHTELVLYPDTCLQQKTIIKKGPHKIEIITILFKYS